MSPCGKYLIRDMPTNLTLYYLITISISVISILITFTALISLFLYPFNDSFASDLSDKRIEFDFFPEYDIFIIQSILSIRLISVFNFNIRSTLDILYNLLYLVNIDLFEIFIFFYFYRSSFLLYRFLLILVLFGYICYYYLYITYQYFKRVYYFIYYSFFIPIYQCRDKSDKYN